LSFDISEFRTHSLIGSSAAVCSPNARTALLLRDLPQSLEIDHVASVQDGLTKWVCILAPLDLSGLTSGYLIPEPWCSCQIHSAVAQTWILFPAQPLRTCRHLHSYCILGCRGLMCLLWALPFSEQLPFSVRTTHDPAVRGVDKTRSDKI
jgi:hypothetical protein